MTLAARNTRPPPRSFEEVDRQHPYSVWATKAQLMAAFAYYQSNKYDDAIIALDRFIQLHPGHRDIPYAYYLKALCYYEQISDVGRDQRITQQALDALSEVVKRFPDIALCPRRPPQGRARHRPSRRQGDGRSAATTRSSSQYVGAINRYRVVIERYQTTTHVPEALHRLVESYLSLGVQSEAQEAAAVLGHNFPGSDWYQDSYFLMTGEGTAGASRRRERRLVLRPSSDRAGMLLLAFDPRLRPDREARPRLRARPGRPGRADRRDRRRQIHPDRRARPGARRARRLRRRAARRDPGLGGRLVRRCPRTIRRTRILAEQGLDDEDALTLRRMVGADGRGRAFVNDQPASVALLRRLGDTLVEIQGQMEQHGLLDMATHRASLDAFAGLEKQAAAVRAAWQAWRTAEQARADAEAAAAAARRDEDFLRHAVRSSRRWRPSPTTRRRWPTSASCCAPAARSAKRWPRRWASWSRDAARSPALRAAHRLIERNVDKAAGRLDTALAALDRALSEATEAQAQLEAARDALEFDPGAAGEDRGAAVRAARGGAASTMSRCRAGAAGRAVRARSSPRWTTAKPA